MYKPLNDILDDVVADILGLEDDDGRKYFRAAKSAAISSEDQLWEIFDAINVTPCAIAFFGPAEYEQDALLRKLSVMICIIDSFKAQTSAKSAGILPLVDAVAANFAPGCPDNQKIVYKELNDVKYELKRHQPVAAPGELTACAMELEATELAAYEIEV